MYTIHIYYCKSDQCASNAHSAQTTSMHTASSEVWTSLQIRTAKCIYAEWPVFANTVTVNYSRHLTIEAVHVRKLVVAYCTINSIILLPSPWVSCVCCRGSIGSAPAESVEVPACSDSVYIMVRLMVILN